MVSTLSTVARPPCDCFPAKQRTGRVCTWCDLSPRNYAFLVTFSVTAWYNRPHESGSCRIAGAPQAGRHARRSRQSEARKRGAARAPLQAERGQPSHQPEPRPRHRPARGHRRRPFADRGPLWRAGGLRRLRGHRDPHHLRHHRRRTPAVRGLAQGPGAPPVPERDRGTAETGGYRRPPQVGRLPRGPPTDEDLPGDPGPSFRRTPRQRLPDREGGRTGVHPGRRRDPRDVRLPGGNGHRQRPQIQRRTPGQGRPGGPDRHLARGGADLRRQDAGSGVAQSGVEADCSRVPRTRSQPSGNPQCVDLPASGWT